MFAKRQLLYSPALLTLAVTIVILSAGSGWARGPHPHQACPGDQARRKIVSYEFIGEVSFPTGYTYAGTEVGGLSGITYDPRKQRYYAISDDRSDIDPARFYTLKIDLADGHLDAGDIAFTGVTVLKNQAGEPFAQGSVDPEGIGLSASGKLWISSEGDANALIPPFVNRFSRRGQHNRVLPIPTKYTPTPVAGIRNNLAFESLTLTPDKRYLYTAVENALVQDGPAADVDQESLARILKYDLRTGQPIAESVYVVEAVPEVPEPTDAFRTNGLVELLALDNNGSLLALERAFSVGKGNTVVLYEVRTQGALDVGPVADLFWESEGIPFEIDPAVQKFMVLDLSEVVATVDNLEGMSFGPELPDGRQTLIIVSDNNFNPGQATQFIALALELDATPAALPTVETPQAVNAEDADAPLKGDSDDPAIWVHPSHPGRSLVIATQKDGGLVVFNMNGKVRQRILPAAYGDIRYNNVDLVYGFSLGRRSVDLAVASDRENDTLAVFRIDPKRRRLVDVTSADMLTTIFGVDDGEATAYGLCTYTSPIDGEAYAFATQADGNLVAQVKLFDAGKGKVGAEVVRILTLPVPTGDPEDSQAEGLVADRELGVLYVAMEEETGILKFDAEPDGGNAYTVVAPIEAPYFSPDIEGLTIYYGPEGTGYLLVSSQGDSTVVVLERSGANAYLGSFVIGDRRSHRREIDQVNESDGMAVLNLPLGPLYPAGLLVLQDGANDPQVVVEDEEELENSSTNFKFVPWQNVAKAFPTPLMIDPSSYHPRR
jgi:myo-inositol-hexaphosphate 3-phosphohydrolase